MFDSSRNCWKLSVMLDFEKTSQNAVSTVFPTTRLVGCLFHLVRLLGGQLYWLPETKPQSDSKDNLPRTNNSVDALHHAFQLSIDGHHPNVYKLISHFIREQENTENKILRYNAGERNRRVLRALEFLLGFCYWIALTFALDIFLLDYLDPCLGVLASRLSFSRSLSPGLYFKY
ncbi:hypothetical protein BgiMline_025902 [Biomphalaria glabrata]|nr:activating transcription factor 7-interacting protein 1 isoform X3 [Biomphalaria glabrata]